MPDFDIKLPYESIWIKVENKRSFPGHFGALFGASKMKSALQAPARHFSVEVSGISREESKVNAESGWFASIICSAL